MAILITRKNLRVKEVEESLLRGPDLAAGASVIRRDFWRSLTRWRGWAAIG